MATGALCCCRLEFYRHALLPSAVRSNEYFPAFRSVSDPAFAGRSAPSTIPSRPLADSFGGRRPVHYVVTSLLMPPPIESSAYVQLVEEATKASGMCAMCRFMWMAVWAVLHALQILCFQAWHLR